MIQLETLSGQLYDKIWLNESENKYSDIEKHILKKSKNPYPEYSPYNYEIHKIYVQTEIKLFNKGIQIYIKYEYIFFNYYKKIYRLTEEQLQELFTNKGCLSVVYVLFIFLKIYT